MRRRLLIGTRNRHKLIELSELLEGLPFEILSLDDFPDTAEPEESGLTFEANARLKAEYYADRFNLWTVADDSGLVVDALGGKPGVFSARYAGIGASDRDNNRKLLAALAHTRGPKRTAQFVCCAALVTPKGESHVVTGSVEGHIADRERGSTGFGYDPLFIPDGYERTFGELNADIKQTISHRARAFGRLREFLETDPWTG